MKNKDQIYVPVIFIFAVSFFGMIDSSNKNVFGVTHTAPIAIAGPDQTVHPGDLVTLDGTKSYDINGVKITNYFWNKYNNFDTNKTGPEVALSFDHSKPGITYFVVPPTIQYPVKYTFELTVNQSNVSSAPSYTEVYVVPKNENNLNSSQPDTLSVPLKENNTINMLPKNTSNEINPGNSSFQMGGPLSSFVSTPSSNWVVGGNWSLTVENGNLSDFSTNMTWYPTNIHSSNIKQHTHSFSNFKPNANTSNILLGANNAITVRGVMDIGAGQDKTYWKSVPAEIKTAGNTLTIILDDLKTGHHFDSYPVFGIITTPIKICSNKPIEQFSADMQISDLPNCS
ncbi:MAG TPA: hypothetical protein VN704_03170 [Verrucomicrobiae bacterium]|nr:hypothetical protein [Verrucomicrobiae bacterium]